MNLEIANSKWRDRLGLQFKPPVQSSVKYLHVFGVWEDEDEDDYSDAMSQDEDDYSDAMSQDEDDYSDAMSLDEDDCLGALMVLSDDSVYGVGYHGRWKLLGLKAYDNYVYPERFVKGLSHKKITSISVGGKVGAAVTAHGKIMIWGRDIKEDYDEYVDAVYPYEPSGSSGRHFIHAACGECFVAALSKSGEVLLWGTISGGAAAVKGYVIQTDPVQSFAAGLYHIAMLSQSGDVYTCGYGTNGALGRKWHVSERYLTAKLVDLDHPCKQVACGANSTLFLLENGSLFATGLSSYDDGHLGIPWHLLYAGYTNYPERVNIDRVRSIAAASEYGINYYAALTDEGHVFTWGLDEFPKKLRGETQLISAFYDAPTPSHLGRVIQPQRQIDPATVASYSSSKDISLVMTDLQRVCNEVRKLMKTMAPLVEQEKRKMPNPH